MKKLIILGLVSLLIISSLFLVEARTAPDTTGTKSKPTFSGASLPTSSSGGKSCLTQWGFDGANWIKRDLVTVYGKTISGKYCVAFDMNTRSIVKKPTVPATASVEPLPIGWFRDKNLW